MLPANEEDKGYGTVGHGGACLRWDSQGRPLWVRWDRGSPWRWKIGQAWFLRQVAWVFVVNLFKILLTYTTWCVGVCVFSNTSALVWNNRVLDLLSSQASPRTCWVWCQYVVWVRAFLPSAPTDCILPPASFGEGAQPSPAGGGPGPL